MSDEKYFVNPFNSAENFLWGMSLFSAGSMRFRWNEQNQNRITFLNGLLSEYEKIDGRKKSVCQVELIHSKNVIAVENSFDADCIKADGIITRNSDIVPVITVADCMPVYLCEPKSGVFGVLHSGWKGTGIVKEALELSSKTYGTKPEDFYIVLGPHIRNCCYNVDEKRRCYFSENFTSDCLNKIKEPKDINFPYSLSLEKANLSLLKKIGIPEDHIFCQGECTCCTKKTDGTYKYGSSRRETMNLPSTLTPEEKSRLFTVQAAFMIHS